MNRRALLTLALSWALLGVPAPATAEIAAQQAQKLPHPQRAPALAAVRAGERMVTAGDYGTILLSEDEGRNWRQANSVPTRVTLTALQFLDARRGWAVGHGGFVLGTEDGGENWKVLHRAGDDAVFFSVRFSDERNGLVVGAFGLALRTEDAGATWSPVTIGDADLHLYQIFPDARGATWIAAESGVVYRSTDGIEFEAIDVPYEGSLWGGIGLRDGTVLVFGMGGTLLRSTDDGRSWTATETGTDNPITAAHSLAGGRVVLVGLGGAVLSSDDGGMHVRTEIRAQRSSYTAVLATADRLVLFGLAGIEPMQP